MRKSRLFLEWLIIAAASAAIVWWCLGSGATNRFDLPLFDTIATRTTSAASDDVLIVGIDDRSLAEQGQWPWDRRKIAQLIDRLSAADAKLIELDVLFVEPSTAEADDALAAAIARSGRVVLAHGFTPAQNRTSGLDPLPPLPMLADAAKAVGHVGLRPDLDGAVRSIPLVIGDQGRLFQHMQLAASRLAGGKSPSAAWLKPDAIPPLLPLRPAGSYRTISASSVLGGELPADFIRQRIVLVGAMASGLEDYHAVPASAGSLMAGVELQANLLQALNEGSFVRRLPQHTALFLLLVPVLLLMAGFWRLRPAANLALAGGLTLSLLATSAALLVVGRVWLPPGPALLAMWLSYPVWGWRRLAAVSNFLMSEANRLAEAGDGAPESGLDGFDSVAQQVSRLDFLVSEVSARRAFLRRVVEAAPDALCVFDRDGGLLLMNARARALFGEEQPHAQLQELILGLDGRFNDEGNEVSTADGRHFLVSHAIGAPDRGDGEIRIAVLADVTEIRKAEAERRHMLEFLSHDMRSPQVAIINLAGTAGEAEGEARRLERISAHARRTLDLADNFVQLARLVEVAIAHEDLDAGMLVEEAVDRAYAAARERDSRLTSQVPDDPVFLTGDGEVLSRVLDNLIGNALKYSPPGSEVSLTVRAEGANAVIEVADNGPGLPEQRRLEPFKRFGSRGPVETRGSGLGLAFVATAVARHDGTITCETAPDQGTRFIITLPITAADAVTPA